MSLGVRFTFGNGLRLRQQFLVRSFLLFFQKPRVEFEVGSDGHRVLRHSLVPNEGGEDRAHALCHRRADGFFNRRPWVQGMITSTSYAFSHPNSFTSFDLTKLPLRFILKQCWGTLVSVSKSVVSKIQLHSRLVSPEKIDDKKGHTIIFTRKKQRQKNSNIGQTCWWFQCA